METKMQNKRPLLSIRAYCLECSCFQPKEVKRCHIKECKLYEYRFGKNPKRKGIAQKKNLINYVNKTGENRNG